MITVYYGRVPAEIDGDAWKFCLEKIEAGRRERLERTQSRVQRLRSLAAGCLLHDALCRELGLLPKEKGAFSIGYREGGKPFLREGEGLFFNLSHSGDYVCCAVGREETGVDIQVHTKVRQSLPERFFTQEDNRRLKEAGTEREALFFRMWSIKESYLKLTGKGIWAGLSSFEIQWEERVIRENGKREAMFAENLSLPGCSLCACFRGSGQTVRWKESGGIFGD